MILFLPGQPGLPYQYRMSLQLPDGALASHSQSLLQSTPLKTNLMKTTPSRSLFPPVLLALCAALLLSGCPTTSDIMSRNDIATLKTTHLAFIDEFTEGAGKTWDDQKLSTRIAAVEKQFSDAEAYEATKKKDARRSAAISNLHSQFKRHTGMLQKRKAFFRAKFAEELRGQVSQNYDQALRGEDVR
jgi:hypothetical protein